MCVVVFEKYATLIFPGNYSWKKSIELYGGSVTSGIIETTDYNWQAAGDFHIMSTLQC